MDKALIVVAMSALLMVAGCSKPAERTSKPAATDAMAKMEMSTEAKSGKGVGKVTAIDPATGRITLDQGAISELQWSAMTMGFDTKPDLLNGIAVGDRVAFEFEWNGKTAMLVRISKR